MKTTLILAIAASAIAGASEKRAPFVPRMTTLQGAALQPSAGLHPASLAAAPGAEPSAGRRGRGPAAVRPMSDAEWRAIFPKNADAK